MAIKNLFRMKHPKLHVLPKACLASKEPNKETAVAVPEHGIFNSWLEDEVGMCENPMDAPIWQDLPQRADSFETSRSGGTTAVTLGARFRRFRR